MTEENKDVVFEELKLKAPPKLLECLHKRDSASILLDKLPDYLAKEFTPSDDKNQAQRVWELFGLWYRDRNRIHEALSIMTSLYDNLLTYQIINNVRVHKGAPLVWISDFYRLINFPSHAKRYLMLTLIEDAITCKGKILINTTGVYFRLVWSFGLSDTEYKRYEREIYEIYTRDPNEGVFPEMILQELDNNWVTEIPSPSEAGVYSTSKIYISYLLDKLGDGSGVVLERLSEYLLSCMPGCRTTRRQRSQSTDYDIVCSIEGFEVDFRSELGRYFVCECKDWKKPADFTTMAKFCRVLDSTKSLFGILFSKKGISGETKTVNAARVRLKVYQDRGMVIVVIDQKDLNYVLEGGNFINLLREKYEKVRLDLVSSVKT